MEFIEGQPLTDLLVPDGLNVDSIMNFGRQIADGLTDVSAADNPFLLF